MIYLPKQRVCSPLTIKSYKEVINLYLHFLQTSVGVPFFSIGFEHVTQVSIQDFLIWLSVERNCSDVTLNHHLAVIRAFLKYASMDEPACASFYINAKCVPLKKVVKRLNVDCFDEATLAALLSQPNPATTKGHRNLFFMILLYDTGARDSEILDLRPCDIVTDHKSPYVVLYGKGRKIRTVPIMHKTQEHYFSYTKRMGLKKTDESPLFFTVIHGKHCRMSDDNVARFLKKYTQGAKKQCSTVPEKIKPHMFRHSRALNLYRNGVPLAVISEWLGHSKLETTLIYSYADTEMKRKAIEKAMSPTDPTSVIGIPDENSVDEELLRYYGLK